MQSTKPGKINEPVRLVWALVRSNVHENSNSNSQYSQICFALTVPSRLANYPLRYRGFLAVNWWKNVGDRPPFNTRASANKTNNCCFAYLEHPTFPSQNSGIQTLYFTYPKTINNLNYWEKGLNLQKFQANGGLRVCCIRQRRAFDEQEVNFSGFSMKF